MSSPSAAFLDKPLLLFEIMFYNRAMTPKPASAQTFDHFEALLFQLQMSGLPAPQREFLFHKRRKWRFDFAWPDLMIAVEVEGGVWSNGRHVRGEGYEKDCEKYNEAQLMGWMVLRFTPGMIKRGKASGIVEKAVRRALDGEI